MESSAYYNPHSRILFISTCSLHKKKGGDKKFYPTESIASKLNPQIGQLLMDTRNSVREILWSGKISWGGVDTAELEYNNNLVPGPDFGGSSDYAEYLPSILRYSGRFYLALGDEGKRKLLQSGHHALFISGLYGLVTPTESIQLYSCPLDGNSEIQKTWTHQKILTTVLADYVQKNGITRIFDLTARNDYRNVIDWNELKSKTKVGVLHCFTKMSAYDYALIEFGNLLRETLLEYTEDQLLSIQPETSIGEVIFRDISMTWDNLPKEEDIFVIQNAFHEVPLLPSYSFNQIPQKLGILSDKPVEINQTPGMNEWFVSFTSEFQKNLSQQKDKKLQGRVLEAIAELAISPMVKRGDTIKALKGPLEGQWRYRIGDFRLIYYPNEEAHKISLIAIRPRGNAYID